MFSTQISTQISTQLVSKVSILDALTYNYFVDKFVDMEKTEIKWTHETTLFLISEYQKRAQKFRNSKLKKKDLWQEISMAFQDCFNTLVSVGALDKKFRNMKQSYVQVSVYCA